MFQCPLSGLVGCNGQPVRTIRDTDVSMPFKRAGWLQPIPTSTAFAGRGVSMPFKRAGWLQREPERLSGWHASVSMPFKRAGWLQRAALVGQQTLAKFQCPLSGLVGCNCRSAATCFRERVFQCPLSGLVGCNGGGWKWLGSKGFGGGFREPRRSGWSERAEMASAAWGSACGPRTSLRARTCEEGSHRERFALR